MTTNKQRGTLCTANQSAQSSGESTSLSDLRELSDLTGDIVRAAGKAVENLLPDDAKADIAMKRKAVAEKYGQIVADDLTGKALDELYQTVAGSKSADEPATNSQQVGVPDPKIYFNGHQFEDTDRAPDPAKYFNP
ncbi:hypothetical protein D7I39_10070 [Allopusillimonas ginsengisoli]|nr:hypothetical protein D7I39_10070 [Allopusillimonas ginsengisoli]